MNALPEHQQPKSADPDFWAVWSGKDIDKNGNEVSVERAVDWKAIADEWQMIEQAEDGQPPGHEDDAESREQEGGPGTRS